MTNSQAIHKNSQEILSGNLLKAILALAIPIIINNFIQTMYNLTDTFWLGKIGTVSQAAISLVSPIQNIVVNFGQGLTLAGSILLSQYIGADDRNNAKDMANHLFLCSMCFSVVCAVLCFFLTPTIVSWLGAQGEVLTQGITYLKIVILDMPFLFMINIYAAIFQAQGNTAKAVKLNIIGIVLNMILDPLFMLVFNWGIAGAAFATLLAKVPCAIVAYITLTDIKKPININLKGFKPQKNKITRIVKLGLPTAIGGSTMQFGFLLMTKNVLVFGDDAMAAYGIGNRINGLISMPSNAIGSAVATIVGQNMGARQPKRAEGAYLLSRKLIVCFLFIAGLILSRNIVSTSIVSIFSDDAKVIYMAADFLSIMAFWCFTNGVYNTTTGLFNATGNTVVTMIVDATRLWVFRFLTLYICQVWFNMGVRSVWYSVVASNGISSLILWILYKMNIWKKDRVRIKDN